GDGSFRAWLSTLAKRSMLDGIRLLEADKRGGGHRRVESDRAIDLAEQLGWTTSTPSRAAAGAEAGHLLDAALATLPEDYRRAVEAYDLAGRTIEEVAATLERSPGAVHMLRVRAHRMLAEALGTTSNYFSRTP
ncbi:MAG: RNA polymerase sigma factor, partial [Planctomycetota bacterium]